MGATWVLMLPLRYGEAIHHHAGVFALRDGLIHRTAEYLAEPPPRSRVVRLVTLTD